LGGESLVQGVETLGDVGTDDLVQFLHGGRERRQSRTDRLGEPLDLLERALDLAVHGLGDRFVDGLAAGEPRLQRDLARVDGKGGGDRSDLTGEIRERGPLATLVKDPTEVRRHLVFQPGWVSACLPARLDAGSEFGDEGVDVGRALFGHKTRS
jgi:hypothetical protein